MLILFHICILSLALAEPPVGDSYLDAVQLSHDHTTHQQYLPPDLSTLRSKASLNTLSDQYAAPNSRAIPQEYGPPEFRDRLSQEYGTPIAGYDESAFRNTISQEYGAPSARLSQQYDTFSSGLGRTLPSASLNNGVSQHYGAPTSRNLPSNLYGALSQRSNPSTQYSAAEIQSIPEEYTRSSQQSGHNSRNLSPVQKYGVPRIQSSQTFSGSASQEYGAPITSSNLQSSKIPNVFQGSRKIPSQTYGSTARSLSTLYGTPKTGKSVTYSELLDRAYGAPNGRSLSQEYSAPEIGKSNYNSNAIASSYSSARSPSQEYGAPSSRTPMPAQQYGAPLEAVSDQGYQYSRNALDLLNQEPANYEFAYKVSDYESGSDFGHEESRQLDRAEGVYFVLLPDGTKQVVEYEADEGGFRPRISVEPAVSPSDRTADGPY